MDKVKDLDLYLLLGVEPDADESVIKKAYRKKALTCHPDKNPDNPKAAELFHQLSEALAVLTDEKAKTAYDNLLKARKRRELENRQLDAKRKKLKDDLEAREKAASENRSSEEALAGARLKAEIERLQKEGQKQMEEEQERLRQTIHQEKSYAASQVMDHPKKVKLRWKLKGNSNNYDVETLKCVFGKYGDVGEVIIMENKKEKGKFSALVEMKSGQAASMAVNIERGFTENPFKKIELINDESNSTNFQQTFNPSNSSKSSSEDPGPMNFNDYETLVMRRLRQEEERKKIIEEMKRQDAEDNE